MVLVFSSIGFSQISRRPQTDGKMDKVGFDHDYGSTMTFNNSTLKFTITANSSYFVVYCNGQKFQKTFDTITITNSVGMHYIYYSTTGVITTGTAAWDITGKAAPIATVYWDGSKGMLAEELHNAERDRFMHNWAHQTIGTRYYNGLAGTFQDSTFTISSGAIFDDDDLDTLGAYNIAYIMYRNASNQMTFDTAVAKSGKATAGILYYDFNGTLTAVNVGRYVNSYIYATNNARHKIVIVIGQNMHTNSAGYTGEALPSIPNIAGQEWKLIYRITLQRLTTTTWGYVAGSAVDYRTSSSLPGASVTSLPASQVTFTSAGNISATNVQAALVEVDSEMVDSLNKKVDKYTTGVTTYWVAGTNYGSDANSGLDSNNAFATFEKAMSMIPEVLNTTYTINVPAKQITGAGNCLINKLTIGAGALNIYGAIATADTTSTHKWATIDWRGVSAGFDIRCGNIKIYYLHIIANPAGSVYPIYVRDYYKDRVDIYGCRIDSGSTAIFSQGNGVITLGKVAVNCFSYGSSYGVYADYNSKVIFTNICNISNCVVGLRSLRVPAQISSAANVALVNCGANVVTNPPSAWSEIQIK